MRPRIYVDSSVIGGCEDEEFAAHSLRLMESFARGDFVLVVSTLTVQELTTAPAAVRKHLAAVPEEHIETFQLDEEAKELAEACISEGVIMAKMRADAQHIAAATVARVDVLAKPPASNRRATPPNVIPREPWRPRDLGEGLATTQILRVVELPSG